MTVHPLPIWALTARAEQAGREKLLVRQSRRVVPEEPEYWCPTCAAEVRGTTFEQRGVVCLVCEGCDEAGLVKLEDL